jgi:hypothetical protein
MKKDNWPVVRTTPNFISGCMYCHALKGEQHKLDCVARRRTVVVKATIEYIVEVPESWNQHDIEFHRNDSSWCTNNMVKELDELCLNNCICHRTEFSYIREATQDDHSDLNEDYEKKLLLTEEENQTEV